MNIELIKKVININNSVMPTREEKEEIMYEIIKQEMINTDEYAVRGIIEDENFIKTKQMIAAKRYNTEGFVELISAVGYEVVNKILVRMLEEKEKENGKPSKE